MLFSAHEKHVVGFSPHPGRGRSLASTSGGTVGAIFPFVILLPLPLSASPTGMRHHNRLFSFRGNERIKSRKVVVPFEKTEREARNSVGLCY